MSNSIFEDSYRMEGSASLFRSRRGLDSYPPTPRHNGNFNSLFPEDWSIGEQIHSIASYRGTPRSNDRETINISRKMLDKITSKRKVFEVKSEKEVKKELRAEKNRLFAQESRKRQKEYVNYLEIQLEELRQIIEIYRLRLAKYELIEKYIHHFEVKVNINPEDKSVLRISLIERQQAIDLLKKMLIEILMPISIKVSHWLKCSDLNLIRLKDIQTSLDITLDQSWKLI